MLKGLKCGDKEFKFILQIMDSTKHSPMTGLLLVDDSPVLFAQATTVDSPLTSLFFPLISYIQINPTVSLLETHEVS